MKTQLLLASVLSLSLITSSAFARGGAGDGGGSVQNEKLAGSYQIKRWLEESRQPVQYVLRRLEFSMKLMSEGKNPAPGYPEIYRKLFKGKKNIFHALTEAVFEPNDVDSCYNTNGEAEDANVIEGTSRICFSMPRLEKKLYENSGKPKIVALIVHEISHLVDTTEEEADSLQTLVNEQVSEKIFSLGYIPQETLERVYGLVEELKMSRASIQGDKSVPPICSVWSMLIARLSDMQNREFDLGMTVGAGIFGDQSIRELFAATVKAMNVWGYCYDGKGDFAKEGKFIKAFGGKSQMAIEDFHVAAFGRKLEVPTYPKGIIIRNVDGKNKAAMLAELKDIENLLKRIYNRSK